MLDYNVALFIYNMIGRINRLNGGVQSLIVSELDITMLSYSWFMLSYER